MNKPIKQPFVIGGVGGSGTRVIADIMKNTGCYIGKNLNVSMDALAFVPLYDKWIPEILSGKISNIERNRILNDINQCVNQHNQDIPDPNILWGWKSPRSIYLLQYFHELFPDMKFIHVLRDGRDMAYSKNQNQVQMYAKYYSKTDEPDEDPRIISMKFWSKVNLQVAEFCNTALSNNYLVVRFEDLCFSPEKIINEISMFFNMTTKNVSDLSKLISVPDSIGRWKSMDDMQIEKLNKAGKPALDYFGYSNQA